MRSLILSAVLVLGARAAVLAEGAVMDAKHTVTASDTLWTLAGKYYDDSDQWRRIYLANKSKIKDPSKLEVGMVLAIPGVEKAGLVPAEPIPNEKGGAPLPRLAPEPAAPKPAPVSAAAQAEVPIPPAPKRKAPVSPEAPKAAAPAAAPAPAAAKAKPPKMEERSIPADTSFDRLSKDFPPPLVGDTLQMKLLPENWKADGYVSPLKGEMAAVGDLVRVLPFSGDTAWKPGARAVIVRRGETRRGKKGAGVYVQRIGTAEVVSGEQGKVRAKVLKMWDAVLEGDQIKLRPGK